MIRLLGPFECAAPDGQAIVVQSKKARGVLAHLALAGRAGVAREHVANLFWPSSGEQQARQSLRQCLSSLRKLLFEGEDPIVDEAGQLSLNRQLVEVDTDVVLQALARGEDTAMQAAAVCARGALLRDHVFGEEEADNWIRDERVRLERATHELLLRCVELYRDAGADEKTIELYWRILAINPASEEAHRGLMEVYERMGRRGDALAQYRTCEDALARHLDAQPSAQTRQLYEQLRRAEGQSTENASIHEQKTLPLPDKPAVAVMAFENLSGSQDSDHVCDGISEDLTTALSQFSSLYVMSRGTAFALKGKHVAIPEIGRQLGVHYVLDGSVRLADKRIRVTVQLVEAEHGGQVWSNRYDGTLKDIFDFQDDIVQRIVATVAGRIEAAALSRARRKATADLDAYECVLRGKYHHHRFTPEDSKQAVAMFQKALEHEPDYALARGWLVCAAGRAASFGKERAQWMSSESYKELLDSAIETVQRGEALDDEESECLRLLGEVHLFRRSYDVAEGYFRRAHAANPNDDRILSQMAAFLTYCGQYEEAVEFAQLAIRLNPFHPGFYRFNLGRALMCLGQYEDAIAEFKLASPMRSQYRAYLIACYAALDRNQEAAQLRQELLETDPTFSLQTFTATMLFRDPAITKAHLILMEKAGLPREN